MRRVRGIEKGVGFGAPDAVGLRRDGLGLTALCTSSRQIHDYLHVMSGLPPTVFAEVVLKWFELVQTGLPLCALGGIMGPVKVEPRTWRERKGVEETLKESRGRKDGGFVVHLFPFPATVPAGHCSRRGTLEDGDGVHSLGCAGRTHGPLRA